MRSKHYYQAATQRLLTGLYGIDQTMKKLTPAKGYCMVPQGMPPWLPVTSGEKVINIQYAICTLIFLYVYLFINLLIQFRWLCHNMQLLMVCQLFLT